MAVKERHRKVTSLNFIVSLLLLLLLLFPPDDIGKEKEKKKKTVLGAVCLSHVLL
jgi:hypothetical protein